MTPAEAYELADIMQASEKFWDVGPVGSESVLVNLITHCMHQQSLTIEMSLVNIAKLAGVSLETARGSVRRLKRLGYLTLLDENDGPHPRRYRLIKPSNLAG